MPNLIFWNDICSLLCWLALHRVPNGFARMQLLSEEPPIAVQARTTAMDVCGNELDVFTESAPLISSMIEDIRGARSRVWLETYIYLDDAAGRAIAAALKERAEAGLDVRVMYDAFGSLRTPPSIFEDMRRSGVAVHAYHTVAEAFRRLEPLRVLNRRDHRKLLVVDDGVAYFGGMNIVDQGQMKTVAQARAAHLPASAGWRDVHLRLEGPAQGEVAAAFDRLWQRTNPGVRREWPRWPLKKMLASRGDGIWFFDSKPGLGFRSPQRVFLSLIRRARRSITIAMAYFLPARGVQRALFQAQRRGVDVTVIVPAQSDVRLVQWATRHLYHRLLKHGLTIYERRDQMLHSKAMVVDDVWTIVGSCNMDPRSLWHNLEFMSAIRSNSLAAEINRICEYEITHSDRVTPEKCRGTRWWQRLLDRAAYAARRWL